MIRKGFYLIILYILLNAISPNLAKAILLLVLSIIYSLVRLLASSAFGTAIAVKQSVVSSVLSVNMVELGVTGLFLLLGFAMLMAVWHMLRSIWR